MTVQKGIYRIRHMCTTATGISKSISQYPYLFEMAQEPSSYRVLLAAPTLMSFPSATIRFNEEGTELYCFMDGYDLSIGDETRNVINSLVLSIAIEDVSTSWTPGDGYLPVSESGSIA